MRGEKPRAAMQDNVCVVSAVVIKTELVVPVNRHCNALTLCDMFNSDNVHFFLALSWAKCD